MAELEYVQVIGRFGITRGDDSAPPGVAEEIDVDDFPDTVWCSEGQVIFEPVTSQVRVRGGTPPFMAGSQAIVCIIDAEGWLTLNGKRYVYLLDLGSDAVDPKVPRDQDSYRVTFVGVKSEGIPVTFAPFSFHPLPNQTNDITVLW